MISQVNGSHASVINEIQSKNQKEQPKNTAVPSNLPDSEPTNVHRIYFTPNYNDDIEQLKKISGAISRGQIPSETDVNLVRKTLITARIPADSFKINLSLRCYGDMVAKKFIKSCTNEEISFIKQAVLCRDNYKNNPKILYISNPAIKALGQVAEAGNLKNFEPDIKNIILRGLKSNDKFELGISVKTLGQLAEAVLLDKEDINSQTIVSLNKIINAGNHILDIPVSDKLKHKSSAVKTLGQFADAGLVSDINPETLQNLIKMISSKDNIEVSSALRTVSQLVKADIIKKDDLNNYVINKIFVLTKSDNATVRDTAIRTIGDSSVKKIVTNEDIPSFVFTKVYEVIKTGGECQKTNAMFVLNQLVESNTLEWVYSDTVENIVKTIKTSSGTLKNVAMMTFGQIAESGLLNKKFVTDENLNALFLALNGDSSERCHAMKAIGQLAEADCIDKEMNSDIVNGVKKSILDRNFSGLNKKQAAIREQEIGIAIKTFGQMTKVKGLVNRSDLDDQLLTQFAADMGNKNEIIKNSVMTTIGNLAKSHLLKNNEFIKNKTLDILLNSLNSENPMTSRSSVRTNTNLIDNNMIKKSDMPEEYINQVLAKLGTSKDQEKNNIILAIEKMIQEKFVNKYQFEQFNIVDTLIDLTKPAAEENINGIKINGSAIKALGSAVGISGQHSLESKYCFLSREQISDDLLNNLYTAIKSEYQQLKNIGIKTLGQFAGAKYLSKNTATSSDHNVPSEILDSIVDGVFSKDHYQASTCVDTLNNLTYKGYISKGYIKRNQGKIVRMINFLQDAARDSSSSSLQFCRSRALPVLKRNLVLR